MTHIYCRLYGIQYRLSILSINMAVQPTRVTVDAADVLRMLPRLNVGAAYAVYSPYRVLKAGRADFKIRKIERTDIHIWRYTFVDQTGQLFETYLKRRTYEALGHGDSSCSQRQGTKVG